MDGGLVRIEGRDGTAVLGPGFRVGKQDPAGELPDDALLVFADKVRLQGEVITAGQAVGVQLEIDDEGLALLDAAGTAPGAFHLAIVDSAGWAGASSGHTDGQRVNWGDLRAILKPIGVARVSPALVQTLAMGTAVGTVTPPGRAVPQAPALAAPANRRITANGAVTFAWDAAAGAGEYLLRMAGYRTQAEPHPAVIEFRTTGAAKVFDAGVHPPLGGAERTFWDADRIAATATGLTSRLVSSSAYTSGSGVSTATARRPTGSGDVAPAVLAITGDQQVRNFPAGAPRAATAADLQSVTALAWSVTALPADQAANSPSAPVYEILVYLQTRIGVVFA